MSSVPGSPSPTGDTPALDKAFGWLTGKMLLWLGKRAHDRGDMHEYDHIVAALRSGNSNHENHACELAADKPKWRGYGGLTGAGYAAIDAADEDD